MESNLYTKFLDHSVSVTVKQLVSSLDSDLEDDERYESCRTEASDSILESLDFDDLTRSGESTRHSMALAPYVFERPEVRARVCPTFHSDTEALEKVMLTVTVYGDTDENRQSSPLYDGDEYASFDFTVYTSGEVEGSSIF